MRIQYFFDKPLPAHETDSEQVLQTVAALARFGHDVELVVPELRAARVDADRLREHYRVRGGFRVKGIPIPPRLPTDARKLLFATQVWESDPQADVLYTRNLPTLLQLSRGLRPFAYETYRPWFDQLPFWGPPLRHALGAQNALGAILHSRYAAERYAALGVAPHKLLVAHNGHDPAAFDAASDRAALRRELGIAQDARVVTYLGHVNLTKGIDSIVALARRVPEAKVLIVGWDGKLGLSRVLAASARNVELVRWQPFERIAYYLKASDVLLLPPRARGFHLIGNTVLPIKLFQYLAAGRPILAPATPDVVELLADGENARLFPEGDLDAAQRALRELLQDAALAERLAASARATAAALTWDARAAKLTQFLEARLASLRSGATA